MADIGVLKRSEANRFELTLGLAATGTPTIKIDRQGSAVLTVQNMSAGDTALEWYYDYTTGASATVGAHQVSYSAVINTVTYSSRDTYYQSISNIDSIIGNGAYNATIHVQDGAAADVSDAFVTIHNSSDDETPLIAQGTTNPDGNVVLNLSGDVYVRVSKAGFTFTSTAKSITGDGTYTVTGAANAGYDNPSDQTLCRLHIFPINYGNTDVTDIATKLFISSDEQLTKINGLFVKYVDGVNFTYNAATTPDSYYFDAIQGAVATIKCKPLGIDQEILVPEELNADLDTLID